MEEAATETFEAVERDVEIISAVVATVPEEMQRDFPPEYGVNTCILSSRVGLEVLRHFKVKVRAVPTKVQVFNESMVRRIGREQRHPVANWEARKWHRQDGSWALGIGDTGNTDPTRFDAHLVLLIHGGDYGTMGGVLADLALHQASRPQRDINLEPMVATVPPDFLGGGPLTVKVGTNVARYEHFPEADGWTMTPDWQDRQRRSRIVERSIATIERKLGRSDEEG
jgi:hypothetical protein